MLIPLLSAARGWAPAAAPPARHMAARGSVACAAAPPAEALALKEELLELLDEEVPEGSRGVGVSSEVASDILEIVEEARARR